MKIIWKYWGWIVLALAVGSIINNWLGPPAVMLLSGFCVFYFSFQAPIWCAVENRNGTLCRENAKGLLMGCHRRQHKWQKLKLTFISKFWRDFGSMLRREPLEGLKTVTTMLGLVGGFVTLTVALVKSGISA